MKTINIILSISIILLISTDNTNGQFNINKKELNKIDFKNITIYIQLKGLSEKQIEQYRRRSLINSVKARYIFENQLLKEVVESHWDLQNTTIEFANDEIKNKLNDLEDVWYLSFNKHTDNFFDRRIHKRNYYYNYSHYELSLFKNKKKIISIPLINKDPSELELVFAINSIQTVIKNASSFKNLKQYAKEINMNANLVSERTLLVPENLTNYSQEYFEPFYNGKIKIVSTQEILKVIHNQDDQYAYLMITINDNSDEPSFNHIILDCEKNQPMLVYRNSTVYSSTCKLGCNFHGHDNKLEFLLGYHLKKYQKIIGI
jgi:hypothetical protein